MDFGPPESRRSERIITLDAGTVEALRQHRETQKLECDLAGSAYEHGADAQAAAAVAAVLADKPLTKAAAQASEWLYRAIRRALRLFDAVVDAEQRHVHRDHDEPDDAADHDDHHRLEDRRQ